MSEAPIWRAEIGNTSIFKLPVELDTTLQLSLDATPPQSVPSIPTSRASSGSAPANQQQGPSQWLGRYRTPGPSAFELLVQNLECKGVSSSSTCDALADQGGEDRVKEPGRHMEWMSFITGCEQGQQKGREEEKEEEEETAAVVNTNHYYNNCNNQKLH